MLVTVSNGRVIKDVRGRTCGPEPFEIDPGNRFWSALLANGDIAPAEPAGKMPRVPETTAIAVRKGSGA